MNAARTAAETRHAAPQARRAPVQPVAVGRPLRRPPRQVGACACGGGCPACRAPADRRALALAPAADPAEGPAARSAALAARGAPAASHGRARREQRIRPPASPWISDLLSEPGHAPSPTWSEDLRARLGVDVSALRLHDDTRAAAAARDLGAQAFTLGRDIVLGQRLESMPPPQASALLGHEVGHAQQQALGAPLRIQRIPANPQETPFDARVVPWSAALHATPSRAGKVLADLPRDHRVTVVGGAFWVRVDTQLDGQALGGYLSHELLEKLPGAGPEAPEEDVDDGTGKDEDDKAPAFGPGGPHLSYDPGLDPELVRRFDVLVAELIARGIGYDASQLSGVRSSQDAHLFSTAFHIFNGLVPVAALRALPNGRDLDGNVWYSKAWETYDPYLGGPRQATDDEVMEQAKQHALAASPRTQTRNRLGWIVGLTYAEEGYQPGDPHRAPNLDSVLVSVHTQGQALDLKGIDWSKLGGEWSTEAIAFVGGFGLWRPFNSQTGGTPDNPRSAIEPWHFELSPQAPQTSPEEPH